MKSKRITRAVARLDTSNQRSLFDDGTDAVPMAAPPAEDHSASALRFEDPDPGLIRLNEVRLDTHLKRTGQHGALKVRELLASLDWSGFEQRYKACGRPPYAPRAMLGLILHGIMQGISSLRALENLARTDLGCMWVSGGILPDHSVIGRFIQRHEAELTGVFFDQLTAQVLRATGSGVSTVAGDGSLIEAAASRFNLMKAEALAQAIEQEQAPSPATDGTDVATDDKRQRRLTQLTEAQEVLQQRQAQRRAKGKLSDGLQINVQEPEAVLQPQKDKKRFAASYKPSVLANDIRIIVGQAVDPASEGAVVPDLLQQAQRHGSIETALFDAGYFSASVINAAAQHDIELLCPEGQSRGEDWNKTSEAYYPKSRFVYDPDTDSYRCPQGQTLRRKGRYKGNERYAGYTLYATSACASCDHKAACTKSSQGRQLKRYASDAGKDALRAKMQQPQARERYVKRQAMVEPVFSHLRYQQGLNRFRRKGLSGVRLEFSLHAMAYNLSRAVAAGRGRSRYGWLLGLCVPVRRVFARIWRVMAELPRCTDYQVAT